MKPSDFKHIVKESLREAFYTRKIVKESTEYMWIGVVDSYGSVHAQQLSFEDWSHHNVIFPGIRGDRWRFDCGDDEIIWTNEPSNDSVIAVEDFLIKHGEHPKIKSGLNEGINGHKMTVNYYGETLPAVLSKNTKPNEKPYRISVFTGTEPRGHIELTQQEAEEILQNHKLPDDVIRIYGTNLKIVNINENLLLLENSSREIDLWLENKNIIVESIPNVTDSSEFKNWFKNSVVVDEHGNPKVMYHATGAEFTEFNPLSHFGTKGQSNSLYYGRMGQRAQKMDRTYPVYLSIQKPLRIDDQHDNSVLSLLQRIDKATSLKYMEEMHEELEKISQAARKKDESEYIKQVKVWRKSRSGPYPQVPTTNSDMSHREFLYFRDTVMPRKYKPILIDIIKKKGYDGLIYKNKFESDEASDFRMDDLPSEPHQKDSYVIFDPIQVKSAIGNVGTFDSNNTDMTKEHLS